MALCAFFRHRVRRHRDEIIPEIARVAAPDLHDERRPVVGCDDQHRRLGESGRTPLAIELVDLNRLVDEAIALTAVFARPRETRVVNLAANRPDGRLRIRISDKGPRIPAERQAELFQPFACLGLETGGNEGIELGLALSRRIVIHHGGQIGHEPLASGGDTFWIDLPKALVAAADADAASA